MFWTCLKLAVWLLDFVSLCTYTGGKLLASLLLLAYNNHLFNFSLPKPVNSMSFIHSILVLKFIVQRYIAYLFSDTRSTEMDEAFTHYQFDGQNLIDNGLGLFEKKKFFSLDYVMVSRSHL